MHSFTSKHLNREGLRLKFLLCIITILLVSCGEEEISINALKNSGYKEANCKKVESFETVSASFIEVNEVLNITASFLIARCFSKQQCAIKFAIDKNRVTCQRYIVGKEWEDKRDYLDNRYKEFVDHEVLYLLINDENVEMIIERAH